jgi:hypothetical protein
MKKLLLAFCLLCAFVAVSFAQTSIKLSLWGEKSVPSDSSVHGFEFGIGTNMHELRGAGVNLICAETDDAKGWQHGGLFTISKQFIGAQTGILLNISEDFEGFCSGAVNWNKGNVTGVQIGLFNIAGSVTGLQLGFFNMAENMHGMQIGLLNFIKTSNVPVMVIANAKF